MRCLLLLIPMLAFAQLDDNSIIVTASRPPAVQPDPAAIWIIVSTSTDTTLDDVLAALKDANITAADLTSLFTSTTFTSSTSTETTNQWTFGLSVPVASVSSTLASLADVTRKLVTSGAMVSVNYGVTQALPATQAANLCPYPALLSDAQKQAQALAQAAGGTVGPILAIADQAPAGLVPATASRTGDFSAVSYPGAASEAVCAVSAPNPAPACSLTVQFKLLH